MDQLMLYIKYDGNGKPLAYAFGPEWVAMAMYMDDMGFKTEDEAVLYWYHHIYKEEMLKNAGNRETESDQTAKDNSADG